MENNDKEIIWETYKYGSFGQGLGEQTTTEEFGYLYNKKMFIRLRVWESYYRQSGACTDWKITQQTILPL